MSTFAPQPSLPALASLLGELEQRLERLDSRHEDTRRELLRLRDDTDHLLGVRSRNALPTPKEPVSVTVLALHLGLSRQRVHQIIKSGKGPKPKVKSPVTLYDVQEWIEWREK